MTARVLPLALAVALLVPATTLAQTPAPAPTSPSATVAAPAPVKGTIDVVAERVGPAATVLVGSRVRVRGVVRPYVAGQTVTVRVVQSGRKVLVKQKQVLKSASGKSGTFLVGYAPKDAGALQIKASHLTTPQMSSAVSRAVTVAVLPRAVPQGSSGRKVRMLQERLKALGYVTGEPGSYDGRTTRAVLAFRKQTGMARIASADKPFFLALARGAGAFKVRFPAHGRHIEGDLTHQTLALIGAAGKVERIYPLSSGKPSTPTVLGTFKIYRKDYGTNAKGMVDASYFHNGYAIHGYAEVPTFPASHGCLRVPVPDARSISDWGRHGTIVDVYYR
ncbi:MAG: L,D-transpeptidase [Solirubrobacterales bacterium]|nr:L,D-transpeptidase [Solirubrobacterales bacterium]